MSGVCSAEDRTQCFPHPKQALFQLSHTALPQGGDVCVDTSCLSLLSSPSFLRLLSLNPKLAGWPDWLASKLSLGILPPAAVQC